MSCALLLLCVFFFFKQKTAYEMRISDWSSDVCSSDLGQARRQRRGELHDDRGGDIGHDAERDDAHPLQAAARKGVEDFEDAARGRLAVKLRQRDRLDARQRHEGQEPEDDRSEEPTSALQSLMRTSYAVLCLKTKNL